MNERKREEWIAEGSGGIHMDGRRDGYYLRAGNRRLLGPPLSWEEAHLIAAAPDLLEACEELTGILTNSTADNMLRLREACNKARAAIAKARGTREEDNTP